MDERGSQDCIATAIAGSRPEISKTKSVMKL